MQLSAKALLKPFNALPTDTNDNGNDEEDPTGCPETIPEDCEDCESDDENDGDLEELEDDKDGDSDEADSLDVLDEEERKKLLEDTLAVRTTLNKVYTYFSPIC